MILLIIFGLAVLALIAGILVTCAGIFDGAVGATKKGAVIVCASLVVILLLFLVVAVPAGNVGVKDTFGNVEDSYMSPGLHLKGNPFMVVVPMNIQTKELTEHYTTLTNEGLDVGVDMTINYKLNPNAAVEIYKTIGIEYESVIVKPQIRSAIRNVIADYDAKQIYSVDRASIATKINDKITPVLMERGIIIEDVVISKADLPSKIKEAIEQKLEAEQLISKKEFDVQTAEMEAKRKIAEARGIADSQAIIDNSLTPEYLKWYWIDGLKDNENVIYVPIDNNGMPIMKSV